jgi:hypothetical protein
MSRHFYKSSYIVHTLSLAWLLLSMLSLVACASTAPELPAAKTESTVSSSETSMPVSKVDAEIVKQPEAKMPAPFEAVVETEIEAEAIKPLHIVESCQDEPYVDYEKQARESMAKGLAATMAKKYGVGFRDLKEHKEWGKTHNLLFTQVNAACRDLTQCAKQSPENRTEKCAKQANIFNEWQTLAARFTEYTKLTETTQPPRICSFTPNLKDLANCFHGLADNIDKACDTVACKETSDCWRGVGYLDIAIKQAEQSCGYVFKALPDCQGYTEASTRRVRKFERCMNMQGDLNITILPAM